MPNDIYPLSISVFIRGLGVLANVLGKAAAHVAEHKIEPSALLTARLFPDMYPLTRQVQVACDTAKRSSARLANVEAPSFEDVESTFEELDARILKTSAFIDGIGRDALLGAGERRIEMKISGSVVRSDGGRISHAVRAAELLFPCRGGLQYLQA